MDDEKRHSFTLENRETMMISDVKDVESFEEDKVVIETTMGMVTVLGSDFRMHKLDVEYGELQIEGWIDEIKYSDSGRKQSQGGFFSRLFQ